ncbi:hypothetical protein POUND7_017962 [Theobroma cacao]
MSEFTMLVQHTLQSKPFSVCSQPRTSHSLVKFLPGFEGPLPFELETGYVDVEESDDVQLFYYFVESERNPGEDPLLLWLTGGPGCSGLSGLVYEIGNGADLYELYDVIYLSSFKSLLQVSRVSSFSNWAKLPCHQKEKALKRFSIKQSVDFVFQSLKRSCRGEYQNINPSNVECQKDLQYYTKCISGIETTHILEPLCSFASPKPQEMYARRRYLDEHQKELLDPEPPILPKIGCRIIPYSPLRNANYTYSFLLSSYWANDGNVQKAIHIRKGSIGQWKRCDFGLPYTVDLPSSFLYHVNLSTRGYRALVYSGDHDMLVPFLGTEAWIKSLNYPIVDDWRPWMVQDQVAGEEGTQLPSTSPQNVLLCLKGGYLESLCNRVSSSCFQLQSTDVNYVLPSDVNNVLPWYVGVGESDDVQLFYYFIKSERNHGEDPLLLWLTGGPGCSGLSGLVYEIGPLNFKVVEYNGSLPTLVLNPYSWTKISSIIFVDSSVGTGFSYATNQHAAQSSDFKQVHHLHQFLQKCLMDHPEFLSNPVYIAGDSDADIILPVIFQEILYGNEEGIRPLIDLQGYILGNPRTVPTLEDNSKISFAHRMALISDELYDVIYLSSFKSLLQVSLISKFGNWTKLPSHQKEKAFKIFSIKQSIDILFQSLKRSYRGEYQNIDPRNVECQKDLQYYTMCISGINQAHILEPLCSFDTFTSPHPQEMLARTCPDGHRKELLDSEPSTLPKFGCRTYSYLLSSYWANDGEAQKAIHIRKGSIGQWKRCNFGLPYTADVPRSFPFHVNLSSRGYRALVYSGDQDMAIPFLGTEAWIKSLNYPIVDDWRPWMVKDQVAGMEGTQLPEYKPTEGFAMFKRWISGEPL